MAKIMVLDDVRDAAVMLQRALEKKGHAVTVFTDEDEALGHAAAHRIELAVIDVKLRKMEGIEFLAELRKLQPETRAIMLTGYPTRDGARRALALGAAAYCAKPIGIRELEEKVEAALAGRPQRRCLQDELI